MWFLCAHKSRRTASARSGRKTFRPRLEAMEGRCLLSAGALDTAFGNGGLVVGGGPIRLDLNTPSVHAVVYPNTGTNPATDGKIVVGGSMIIDANSDLDFLLTRYNSNGTLDSNFGNGGIVQTAVGAPSGLSHLYGVALQSDGKIVAVGSATLHVQKGNTNQPVIAVARYSANGSLDTTFGGGNSPSGIVLTNVAPSAPSGTVERATAVAIQPDGKIDVAGYIVTLGPSGTENIALVRYNANGTLDTTFGLSKNGIVLTPQFGNSGDEAYALAIQSDGKIVLAGNLGTKLYSPVAMAVVRYTPTGQLDSSFGTGGIVMGLKPPSATWAAAFGVLVQNGAIVAAGSSDAMLNGELTLVRLTSTGQLDSTFGNSGFAIDGNLGSSITNGSTQGSGDALALGANGDLLATGGNFGVAAFLPNGAPDTTFGTGGTTLASFSGGAYHAYAMAIQGDGKAVVAGSFAPSGSSTTYVALARFLAPDTKIGLLTGSSADGNVTLNASNIMNSNPTSAITQVYFYLQHPDLSLALLGTGTNNSGTWTITFSETAYGLTSSSTYTFVAQAVDSNGVSSDPLSISLEVM
jgi:uncharacterized delta-60 repeat protein